MCPGDDIVVHPLYFKMAVNVGQVFFDFVNDWRSWPRGEWESSTTRWANFTVSNIRASLFLNIQTFETS